MDFKRIRDRARMRHLARRGDAILGAQEFWDAITYLSRELIPEDEREISRDLFTLIAYAWGVAAERGCSYDPFDVLRVIRDRAWLGYADTPALIEQVRRDLPRAEMAGRMTAYFDELDAKRSTYLFLPIVSRIDRHQLGPLPRQLELDRTMADYSFSRQAAAVRQLFLAAPGLERERDLFFHALHTSGWASGIDKVVSGQELSVLAARQLRLLYEYPARALAAVCADAASHKAASRSIEVLQEMSTEQNRPLLLEALFIAESMATGAQYFGHAFEIQERFI